MDRTIQKKSGQQYLIALLITKFVFGYIDYNFCLTKQLLNESALLFSMPVAFCKDIFTRKTCKSEGHHFQYVYKGLENREANDPVLVFENGMGVGLSTWIK